MLFPLRGPQYIIYTEVSAPASGRERFDWSCTLYVIHKKYTKECYVEVENAVHEMKMIMMHKPTILMFNPGPPLVDSRVWKPIILSRFGCSAACSTVSLMRGCCNCNQSRIFPGVHVAVGVCRSMLDCGAMSASLHFLASCRLTIIIINRPIAINRVCRAGIENGYD